VCGETVGSKRTVRAPDGRLVCETCVEEARQVLQSRRAREARVEAELRKRKELERVEGDNRLVLELQADEWLTAASNSCPSCGRFIALADAMCHGCGYGAPIGAPKRAFSFGRRSKAVRPISAGGATHHQGGPVEDLLETIDARLVRGLPAALSALAIVGLLLSFVLSWTWSAAIMGMIVMGVAVFAGSIIILFQQSPKDAVPIVLTGLVAGAAAIVAAKSPRIEVDVASAFGAAAMCGAACWASRRVRLDETLTWAWGGLAASCLVAAGVLASLM
jgi:hypothetical protein